MNISYKTCAYQILIDQQPTCIRIQQSHKGWMVVDESDSQLSNCSEWPAEEKVRFGMAPDQNWVWEFPPSPSNRTEDFYRRARFATSMDAYDAFHYWAEHAEPARIQVLIRRYKELTQ